MSNTLIISYFKLSYKIVAMHEAQFWGTKRAKTFKQEWYDNVEFTKLTM